MQLYSLKRHGATMISMFERCRGHRFTLLLVVDSEGTVFGGVGSEEWRNHRDRYFGSGESWLFTFKDDRFAKYTWTRNVRACVRLFFLCVQLLARPLDRTVNSSDPTHPTR